MGVGSRLRALDDAVLGHRLRRPLPPAPVLQRNVFLFGLAALLLFCAVSARYVDGVPYGVAVPWLVLVLANGAQWRRARAGSSGRARP